MLNDAERVRILNVSFTNPKSLFFFDTLSVSLKTLSCNWNLWYILTIKLSICLTCCPTDELSAYRYSTFFLTKNIRFFKIFLYFLTCLFCISFAIYFCSCLPSFSFSLTPPLSVLPPPACHALICHIYNGNIQIYRCYQLITSALITIQLTSVSMRHAAGQPAPSLLHHHAQRETDRELEREGK